MKKKINTWQIATIVFAVLFLLAIFNVFSFSGSTAKITGNAIGYINENLLEGTEAELINSEKEHGIIKANLLIEGQPAEIYISPDGKLLFPVAIPLEEIPQQFDSQPPVTEEDWTVFENELPLDIKSKILSFEGEEPEVYEGRILEFNNFELIPNTLIAFYSHGCGWCTRYYPVLLEAKEKYPEVAIYTLQLGNYRDVADKYGITGTPGNVINGKYKVSGYMPIEDLSEILDKLNL